MNMEVKIKPREERELEDWVASDCHGLNFFDIDSSLQDLLTIYLPDDLRAHMTPVYRELGEVAGNRLDELSRICDRHLPVLHPRDARGRNRDWIEYHPAFREMEKIGYGDFGIHCMSRRAGVHGWPTKVPPMAKYVFQYLFTQSEFGLMCPISLTDTSSMLLERYGPEEAKEKFLPRMRSQDMDELYRGAQFMTEKIGGSEVANLAVTARQENGEWRLYGDKWFCSSADAEVCLVLARPEGAPKGNSGLAIFAVPRFLDNGDRNDYRIVRLKDKMGTKSMASGEIIFNGALAYAFGDVGAKPNPGLRQMLDQVNMSRLSHGVRAAGMMRRCLNEAMMAARTRDVFGEMIINKPLLRRQLLKIMVPTEQVLSMVMHVSNTLHRAEQGDEEAKLQNRILTALLKFRACRDNITVATGALEVRGGNGFIEDWVNSRLVRDAHTGLLWEGTSNINALDVTTRAIAKAGAHEALAEDLKGRLASTDGVPGQYAGELSGLIDRAVKFADEIAATGNEIKARQASNALYHATSATLLATEGATLGRAGGDARRMLLSRLVVDTRLRAVDPLTNSDGSFEIEAGNYLLSDAPVPLDVATDLLRL
ncbi:MAG: DNA alkylation response protein [Sneathiella sp.]|mgnify:CR=1 FL=1|jgi:alkylation response protein AidB-like acyl-CoA dehydrogenase|uniref:acyl-CoA dehydrogenase family protein n=1 Tax=Sneathiella sp. TaxID=1964365 RepID=UPI000C5A4489|nr:acyl-CoA dehydrogenase family protein [Sneathiella sp.]MAL80314.1 DNA alkylation response protein [Sneathiella sp.]